MTREPDLAWEALVTVTRANPHFERGKLNAALRAIRDCHRDEGLVDEELPREIELRAKMYRLRWPGMELTPTALAKHWIRVAEPVDNRSEMQRSLDRLREEGR